MLAGCRGVGWMPANTRVRNGPCMDVTTCFCRRMVVSKTTYNAQLPAPSSRFLLDDLVGAGEQRRRHLQAERLGGPQVDRQFEFRRLLDWQVRGLRALQDLVCVEGSAPEQVGHACSIGDQAASRHDLLGCEHPRQTIAREEIENFHDADLMQGIGGHQECVGTLADSCRKSVVELFRTARCDRNELHAERPYHGMQLCELGRVRAIVRIPKKGHAGNGWNNLLDELQAFARYLRAKDGIAGDIASGPGEARHQPGPYRISNSDHDDGDRLRRLLGRAGWWRSER